MPTVCRNTPAFVTCTSTVSSRRGVRERAAVLHVALPRQVAERENARSAATWGRYIHCKRIWSCSGSSTLKVRRQSRQYRMSESREIGRSRLPCRRHPRRRVRHTAQRLRRRKGGLCRKSRWHRGCRTPTLRRDHRHRWKRWNRRVERIARRSCYRERRARCRFPRRDVERWKRWSVGRRKFTDVQHGRSAR